MKKYHVLATIGTLALLANLLVPGLSFAAGEAQTGTATLTCLTTAPAFTIRPDTAFDFTADGVGGALYSKLTNQDAFKDPAGSLVKGADQADGNDFFEVEDVRDPADPTDCNPGLRVSVVENGTTFLGALTSETIPLTGVYVVTDPTATCGYILNNVCFDAAALCGKGTNVAPDVCTDADEGVAPVDAASTGFTTIGTFTGVSNNTLDSERVLLRFDQTAELIGKAGVATSFAVTIPGGTPTDVYTLGLTYTVYATAT